MSDGINEEEAPQSGESPRDDPTPIDLSVVPTSVLFTLFGFIATSLPEKISLQLLITIHF